MTDLEALHRAVLGYGEAMAVYAMLPKWYR